MRCDHCGRFCSRLNDVWARQPYPSIESVACDACFEGGAAMSQCRHFVRLRFVTYNTHARRRWGDDVYWYDFRCDYCDDQWTFAKDKFWR